MAQRTFELTTKATAAPHTAFEFLTDFNNHRDLHLYFVQAEIINAGQDRQGRYFKDYIVTERPRLAFFNYTITFPTRLTIIDQWTFTAEVEAALSTRLVNMTRIQPRDSGCLITEHVTVNAPWLTIGYVSRQARQAHRATFDRLPAVLERRQQRTVGSYASTND